MTPIRVTFLTDIPTPYIVELLRALSLRVELTVLFCADTSTRGMQWRFDEELGFNHVVIGGAAIRRRDAEGTDYYFSPKILTQLIRSRPDVVISGGFSIPSLYALLYCRLWRAKLMLYSDGTGRSERDIAWHQKLTRRLLVPRAAACIAKSSPAARRFEELGAGEKVFLAPHTTNLAPLFEIADKRSWLEHDELRVLCVGRLIKRKGTQHLIKALAAMRPTRRPVRLTIIGTGPEEHELRELVRALELKRVDFVGFTDQKELPNYYGRADVFVFPTLMDPFGIVLLEAAASGLALVASSGAGATEELVRDGQNGFVFEPQDEAVLADRIAMLADNQQLVVQLGRAAHQVALDRTPDQTAKAYVSAINSVLGR